MNSNTDKCKQFRELHDRLSAELRVLKESEEEEELEGVENPLGIVNVIKSLQKTLNTVEFELKKCQEANQ